jgi:hypothetical protein
VDANEQFVREKWDLVHQCDGSYRDYPRGTVLIQDGHGHWLDFDSWAAAAEFTRERLEKIRQVEEEIGLVREKYQECFEVGKELAFGTKTRAKMNEECLIWQRVIAAEEERLATLKRGMKASFDREGSVGK